MKLKLGLWDFTWLSREKCSRYGLNPRFHALTKRMRTTGILCLVYSGHDIAARQKKTDIVDSI